MEKYSEWINYLFTIRKVAPRPYIFFSLRPNNEFVYSEKYSGKCMHVCSFCNQNAVDGGAFLFILYKEAFVILCNSCLCVYWYIT